MIRTVIALLLVTGPAPVASQGLCKIGVVSNIGEAFIVSTGEPIYEDIPIGSWHLDDLVVGIRDANSVTSLAVIECHRGGRCEQGSGADMRTFRSCLVMDRDVAAVGAPHQFPLGTIPKKSAAEKSAPPCAPKSVCACSQPGTRCRVRDKEQAWSPARYTLGVGLQGTWPQAPR
jgi:hypothetical protein